MENNLEISITVVVVNKMWNQQDLKPQQRVLIRIKYNDNETQRLRIHFYLELCFNCHNSYEVTIIMSIENELFLVFHQKYF